MAGRSSFQCVCEVNVYTYARSLLVFSLIMSQHCMILFKQQRGAGEGLSGHTKFWTRSFRNLGFIFKLYYFGACIVLLALRALGQRFSQAFLLPILADLI